jgi:hypothetical protein
MIRVRFCGPGDDPVDRLVEDLVGDQVLACGR